MLAREISSLQHPIVKDLVKLRTSRSEREATKSALLSGHKLVEEAALYTPIKRLLIEKNHSWKPQFKAKEVWVVTEEILKKVTGLKNPEPIAAVIDLPPPASLEKKTFLLILDGINDPGNLGTLLRTALALGWQGVFLTPSTTDPFNEKAIRAAKGATFRLPLASGSYEDLHTLLQKNQMHLYIATMQAPPLNQVKLLPPMALVLGNESNGVSNAKYSTYTSVSIPMEKEMESLNVAIAGAILMYEMKTSLELKR